MLVHTNAFSLASLSVMPQTLSVLMWTLPFSHRFHEDGALCAFIWIHFRERFHIDAVSPKTFSFLVWTEGLNASKIYPVSNENTVVWTGPGPKKTNQI